MLSSISIIIPCFQCAKWLPITLESCLQQKKYIKEIIVVDDFSEDNSWSILEQYATAHPSIIKIYRNKIKGGNNARNYGFSLSTGDYIQWLDADDQIKGNKFELQLQAFSNNKNIDVVYSDWLLHTYNGNTIVKTELKKNRQYKSLVKELLIDNWSTPHCYLLKRSFAEMLHKINAWNPATSVFQDREYFTMAAIIGGHFYYTSGYFAVYNRWNKLSISNGTKQDNKNQQLDKLLKLFEDVVNDQNWITALQKQHYVKIIDTQRLLLKASNYPAAIKKNIRIRDIYWPMIKGIRTRLKLLHIIINN